MARRDVTVREFTTEDNVAVSSAVARVFEDDPIYMWLFADDASRLRKMTAMNEAMFPKLVPIDFFEVHTTDDCTGISIWAGPEKWEPPTTMVALLSVMPRLLRIMGFGGTAKMMRPMGLMKKNRITRSLASACPRRSIFPEAVRTSG
jgi:hypothetical protein